MRQRPWIRVVVEGGVIVFSILLAFAIDAWWEGVQDREAEALQLDNLRTDFEVAKRELEEKRYFHALISSSATEMLAALKAAPPSARVVVVDTLVIAVMVNPTLDIATTHEELELSADISSIADHDLRSAVVDWPRVVRDAVAIEQLATEVNAMQLMPLLHQSADLTTAWGLNIYWSTRHQAGRAIDREVSLISVENSLELRNGLAERIRHEDVIVLYIERSIDHVEGILSLIDGER